MSFSINRQVTFFICLACVLFFALRLRAEDRAIQTQRSVDPITCNRYVYSVDVGDGYKAKVMPTTNSNLPGNLGFSQRVDIVIGDVRFKPFWEPKYKTLNFVKSTDSESREKERASKGMRAFREETTFYAETPSRKKMLQLGQDVTASQGRLNIPQRYGRLITAMNMDAVAGLGMPPRLQISSGLDAQGPDQLNFSKYGEKILPMDPKTEKEVARLTAQRIPVPFSLSQQKRESYNHNHVMSRQQLASLFEAVPEAQKQSCLRSKGTVAPSGRSQGSPGGNRRPTRVKGAN